VVSIKLLRVSTKLLQASVDGETVSLKGSNNTSLKEHFNLDRRAIRCGRIVHSGNHPANRQGACRCDHGGQQEENKLHVEWEKVGGKFQRFVSLSRFFE
jgi:hypothetical protein